MIDFLSKGIKYFPSVLLNKVLGRSPQANVQQIYSAWCSHEMLKSVSQWITFEFAQGNGDHLLEEVMCKTWGQEGNWTKIKLINYNQDDMNAFLFFL